MRLKFEVAVIAALAVATFAAGARPAKAQDEQVLMPEQSAAKAKQIIQQAIDALGGQTYLNIHDITYTGRLGQFGHSGELNGFETFVDYEIPPSMDRTENLPKRNIIEVYNGDKGWVLDRGGVSEAAATDVARYQEDTKVDIYNILRYRIHEPNMVIRYAGPDVVDLKEAQWVELVDNENRTIRIAFADGTHFPIRKVVETRDPSSQLRGEEIEYYSLYHPIDGIETPFQITRERNGMKIYQVFFDTCKYNSNLEASLFTKESLDERWAKVGKKSKNKKNAKADKDSNDTEKD